MSTGDVSGPAGTPSRVGGGACLLALGESLSRCVCGCGMMKPRRVESSERRGRAKRWESPPRGARRPGRATN
eukprot:6582409-Prymnesium_polylepis.1